MKEFAPKVMGIIQMFCFLLGQIFLAHPSIALRSQDPKTSRTSSLHLQHFTSPISGSMIATQIIHSFIQV